MGFLDRFKKAPAKAVSRVDGWVNPQTGIGTLRDKSNIGFFVPDAPLADLELSALYYHDDLAARIVDERIDQSFRKGYKLAGLEQDQIEKLEAEAKRIEVDRRFKEAWRWGRLYGSSLLIVGALDGHMPTEELNPETTRGVAFLNPIDKRTLQIYSRYSNPMLPQYGEPNLYQINPEPVNAIDLTTGAYRSSDKEVYYVHESRCIRFNGVETDLLESQKLAGWSYSVLQRVYKVLRQFGLSFSSASILIEEASQGVFKIDGLLSMLTGNERQNLLDRMSLVDMSKGAARSILVDAANEDYTRIPVNFSGLPDMLDRVMQRLAAATGMPVTLLMGQSPAGMNATGASDFQHWYDSIASEQEKELTPRLLKIYQLLAQGLGIDATELEIEWQSLVEDDEGAQAENYSKIAAADIAYISAGVLMPEEVALARWGSGTYDGNAGIDIDVEWLEDELEKAKTQPEPAAFVDPLAPKDPNAPETKEAQPGKSENPGASNPASNEAG